MNAIRFIQEYIKNPSAIGAVMPSSKQLAKQMVEEISFAAASCVVEYGPGTGVFTEELIQHKGVDAMLLLIEQNPIFCEELREKYSQIPNVHIVCGSAEEAAVYLEQHGYAKADYVASGLPFTSLPAAVSHRILEQTLKILGDDGTFITFQYTKVKQTFFRKHFRSIRIKKVYWNVPPAYVFICSNR
ncbi:class I SAM-dependent methyltransferase [Ectobacillus ponti]|uniref:SAM-dependent methyltransferase n=1 Tax=Ectobacillus ponti TaxID=2961894 RepID=A0AA41X9N5_9BACI|nr:rRNA adenine N-6-methyltransferase family protein [Ectobacillus ponti]MCP8969259.1 SAM-dependent methyltransferase [Ectobacillus ponti]